MAPGTKHAKLTYSEVFAFHRGYAEWCRDPEHPKKSNLRFVHWLNATHPLAEPPRDDDVIGFGKRMGMTYVGMLEKHLGYAEYCRGKSEPKSGMARIARWLDVRDPLADADVMGFGKHSEMTYADVREDAAPAFRNGKRMYICC